ncbi:sodium:solute symporter family protein [Salinisphaera sp. USBA-960]|nr:sodium:solute symporter family protein [Salifodinibacter halophilus]NNC26334.1 sodium:solute symporter family protein [Salifodinibacter halophilus]
MHGGHAHSILILTVLAVYMLVILAIGWYASRKVHNSSDYVVAGRRLGFGLGTGALIATWFGAGTVMGGAGNAYIFGNQGVIFDPWGAGACLIIVGFFFGRLLRRGRYISLADLYTSRYGKGMGILSMVSMVIAEMGWTGAMLVGFGSIIHYFTGLSLAWGIGVSTVVMVTYTMKGGMWAVTLTDSLQLLVLFVGLIAMLIVGVPQLGGWSHLFGANGAQSNMMNFPHWSWLPHGTDGFMGYTGLTGWVYWVGAWITIGFGSIPAQNLTQRVLAARDERTTVGISIVGGVIYILMGLIPVSMAMLYFQSHPGLTIQEASNELLLLMASNYLTATLLALFVCALVAALMSSAAGAVLAASTLIGDNGYRLLTGKQSNESTLKITRYAIPVVTGVSLWLALDFKTIYHLMVIAWSILLVSLFASYVAAFFWWRANETGAIAGFIVGFATWIGCYYWYLPITSAANTDVGHGAGSGVYFQWAMWDALYIASVWGLVGSIVCLVVVSLATQRINKPKPLVDIDGNPMRKAGWFGISSR